MTEGIIKSLEGSGAPAREFWESDLEMALDHILVQSGQDGFIDEWIGRRTGRQIGQFDRRKKMHYIFRF